MYLHLGNGISVPTDDIIGIFDLDNAVLPGVPRIFFAQRRRRA